MREIYVRDARAGAIVVMGLPQLVHTVLPAWVCSSFVKAWLKGEGALGSFSCSPLKK